MPTREYFGPDAPEMLVSNRLCDLNGPRIGLDIETTGLNPLTGKVLLLQLSDGQRTLVIHEKVLTTTLVNIIDDLFFSGSVLLVGHNLTFEHKWLKHHYGLSIERCYDTRWAHLAIHNGTAVAMESNLGHVTWVALGRTRDEKEELQKSFIDADPETFIPTPEQIEYAAVDAEDVLEIMDVQMPKIKERGLAQALKLRFDMIPVVGEMELNGAPVDKEGYANTIERAKALLVEVEKGVIEMLTPPCLIWRDDVYQPLMAEYMDWKAKYEEHKAWLETCADRVDGSGYGFFDDIPEEWESKRARRDWLNLQARSYKEGHPAPAKPKLETGPINLNSWQQVLGALRQLGYNLDSTSADTLEEFAEEHPKEAEEGKLGEYLLFKKLAKLVQAFGEPVLNKMHATDGGCIIQPSWNLMVSTGRMSCSEPNLQQVTKPLKVMGQTFDLREHFAAPEGYEIGAADFSNIELRIAADLSGDERAIQDFIDGLDFHGRTAAVKLGISYEEGQELRAAHDFAFTGARNDGKIRNFATLYGAWDEEWREVFSTAYPRMWEWLEENGLLAVQQGYAQPAGGMRKAFPLGREPHQHAKRWDKFKCEECKEWRKLRNRIIRQAKNFPMQELSARITMAAAVAVRRELILPSPEAIRPRLWSLVHDEADFLIRQPYGERVMKRVKEISEREGARFLKRVPVVVEIATGPSWSACK